MGIKRQVLKRRKKYFCSIYSPFLFFCLTGAASSIKKASVNVSAVPQICMSEDEIELQRSSARHTPQLKQTQIWGLCVQRCVYRAHQLLTVWAACGCLKYNKSTTRSTSTLSERIDANNTQFWQLMQAFSPHRNHHADPSGSQAGQLRDFNLKYRFLLHPLIYAMDFGTGMYGGPEVQIPSTYHPMQNHFKDHYSECKPNDKYIYILSIKVKIQKPCFQKSKFWNVKHETK